MCVFSLCAQIICEFFFWCQQPLLGQGLIIHEVSNHTQRHTTVGMTPPDEWSARRRDLYLTTHNTYNRGTSSPPVGFEPTIPVEERPQIHALDRKATWAGIYEFSLGNISTVRYVSCALRNWRKMIYNLWYWRLSQLCCWRFVSSGILHRVVGWISLRLFEYIFPSFSWSI